MLSLPTPSGLGRPGIFGIDTSLRRRSSSVDSNELWLLVYQIPILARYFMITLGRQSVAVIESLVSEELTIDLLQE